MPYQSAISINSDAKIILTIQGSRTLNIVFGLPEAWLTNDLWHSKLNNAVSSTVSRCSAAGQDFLKYTMACSLSIYATLS